MIVFFYILKKLKKGMVILVKKKRFKMYDEVTNRIIKRLEEGIVTWQLPWNENGFANLPMKWLKQEPYNGINLFLLPPGEYASFKQISNAGGHVKKGEKAHPVVFWKELKFKEEDEETGEEVVKTFMKMKYFNVFEINTQCTGVESKMKDKEMVTNDFDPIEKCEEIIRNYKNKPKITYDRSGAWYKPKLDILNVPPMEDFKSVEEFYSTTFHEAGHSTGHENRLNRKGIANFDKFGSKQYSKEELIAELTAVMLCAEAGIENKI